jgi:hypothetical protein
VDKSRKVVDPFGERPCDDRFVGCVSLDVLVDMQIAIVRPRQAQHISHEVNSIDHLTSIIFSKENFCLLSSVETMDRVGVVSKFELGTFQR